MKWVACTRFAASATAASLNDARCLYSCTYDTDTCGVQFSENATRLSSDFISCTVPVEASYQQRVLHQQSVSQDFMLTMSSGKRNVTAWRLSVCLSRWHTHRDQRAAIVNFGQTIKRTDILVLYFGYCAHNHGMI